jgi:hypothetical protein
LEQNKFTGFISEKPIPVILLIGWDEMEIK